MHCKSTALTDEIQAILLMLILANLHHFLGVTGFGPTFLISFFFWEVFLMVSMWCLGKKNHPKLQNQICWAIIFLRKKAAPLVLCMPSKSASWAWRQAKGAQALAPGHRPPRFPGHQWHHWSHQDLTSGSPQLGWLYLDSPLSRVVGRRDGRALRQKHTDLLKWSSCSCFFSNFFFLNNELCIYNRYIYAYIHCFHSIKMVDKNWNRVGTNCSRKAWNCLSQVFVRHVLWRNLVNRVRWVLGGASHCNTTVS